MYATVKSLAGLALVVAIVCIANVNLPAQERRGGQPQGRGGGEAARASTLPLFLDAKFVRPASQTGQTKVVQENIGDANVELKQYGLHESCLLTSGNPGSETTPSACGRVSVSSRSRPCSVTRRDTSI